MFLECKWKWNCWWCILWIEWCTSFVGWYTRSPFGSFVEYERIFSPYTEIPGMISVMLWCSKLVSQETMLTFSYSPIDSVHCNCYKHSNACLLTCIGKMFMHLGLFLASIMLHEMHVSFLHILISWMKYTESRSYRSITMLLISSAKLNKLMGGKT